MSRIVSHSFYDAKPFRSSFAEEDSIPSGEVLRSLDEAESNRGTVARSDESTINVDDCTGLRDGTDVQHGLVLGFDCGSVT